ncbi:hypothetical protein M406DRAFT_357177, partial [Cryphonectria parasitica EP155]
MDMHTAELGNDFVTCTTHTDTETCTRLICAEGRPHGTTDVLRFGTPRGRTGPMATHFWAQHHPCLSALVFVMEVHPHAY